MPIPPYAAEGPHGVFGRAFAAFAASPAGHWIVRNISPRVDPFLLRVSRGRASSIAIHPVVMLTARGARSGEPRSTPLLYFTDGERVVLMASNYGGKRHPAWYHNVKANPEVTLTAGGHEARYVGREATGEERERLWTMAKRLARNYSQYEQLTGGRQIPVMVFTPVDGAPAEPR
jgi:deazaflavin-dependent oxidoreductase (nitroreductase family)